MEFTATSRSSSYHSISSDDSHSEAIRPVIQAPDGEYDTMQPFLTQGPWDPVQCCRFETGHEASLDPGLGAPYPPEFVSPVLDPSEPQADFMTYGRADSQVSLISRRSGGSKSGRSSTPDGPPFECPLCYNPRRTSFPEGCETVSVSTEDEAIKHGDAKHYWCPICRCDPPTQRRRSHKPEGIMTKPTTWRDWYWCLCKEYKDHIWRHLVWIPCHHGCGRWFFNKSSKSSHEKECRLRMRETRQEQSPHQAMVELRDAVKRCFNEVQEPAALSERLKDVLIDQQSGRKIFDSREEINRLPIKEDVNEARESSPEINSTSEGILDRHLSPAPLTLAGVDQFVERFGALPEEQRGSFACRLISGFQQHDIQLLRDILLAADEGRSSRKRGCSEVASEAGDSRRQRLDSGEGRWLTRYMEDVETSGQREYLLAPVGPVQWYSGTSSPPGIEQGYYEVPQQPQVHASFGTSQFSQ